jgi:hypothetical protein
MTTLTSKCRSVSIYSFHTQRPEEAYPSVVTNHSRPRCRCASWRTNPGYCNNTLVDIIIGNSSRTIARYENINLFFLAWHTLFFPLPSTGTIQNPNRSQLMERTGGTTIKVALMNVECLSIQKTKMALSILFCCGNV